MNTKTESKEVEEGVVVARCGLCILFTVAMILVVIAGLVAFGLGGL